MTPTSSSPTSSSSTSSSALFQLTQRLLITVVVLLSTIKQTHSAYFPCRLSDPVDVWYHTKHKNLSLVELTTTTTTTTTTNTNTTTGTSNANNSHTSTRTRNLLAHHYRTLNVFGQETQENEPNSTELVTKEEDDDDVHEVVKVQARKCWCASGNRRRGVMYDPEYYCLILHDENYCSVPWFGSNSGSEPICYKRSGRFSLAKNLWVPSIIIVLLYFVLLCTTKCGKNAMSFLPATCCPSVNQRTVERILRREEETRQTIRDEIRQLGQRDDGMIEHRTLIMKTKSFESTTTGVGITSNKSGGEDEEDVESVHVIKSKNEGEEVPTCSICMIEVEDGDRIGDLPCGHSFHVDCLKEWVLWRNVCPLCQDKDIASVRVSLKPAPATCTFISTNTSGNNGVGEDNDRTNSNNAANTGTSSSPHEEAETDPQQST